MSTGRESQEAHWYISVGRPGATPQVLTGVGRRGGDPRPLSRVCASPFRPADVSRLGFSLAFEVFAPHWSQEDLFGGARGAVAAPVLVAAPSGAGLEARASSPRQEKGFLDD